MVKQLFCMGNPLLDISSNVDMAFLEKYGLKTGDAVLAEEKHMPLYKELAERSDVVYVPGGATLNSARVANWVLPNEKFVTYAGSVAEDEFGSLLVKGAEKEGLAMEMHLAKDVATGTCGVCVVDKERSLCANLAAASKFDAKHVEKESVKKAIENASVYYIAGFFITTCQDALLAVAKHASEHDEKVFTMNLSAPFIIDFFTEQLDQALKHVDILFGNETEARSLAAKKEWKDDAGKVLEDVAAIAARAQKDLPKEGKARMVVFTQGSTATVVATADGVNSYAVPKVENITDTNGAGDAFVGGFLAMYAQGKDIETCVQTGHKSAGRIIQVSGTQFASAF